MKRMLIFSVALLFHWPVLAQESPETVLAEYLAEGQPGYAVDCFFLDADRKEYIVQGRLTGGQVYDVRPIDGRPVVQDVALQIIRSPVVFEADRDDSRFLDQASFRNFSGQGGSGRSADGFSSIVWKWSTYRLDETAPTTLLINESPPPRRVAGEDSDPAPPPLRPSALVGFCERTEFVQEALTDAEIKTLREADQ